MSDQPAATPEQPKHRFSNREEVRQEVLQLAKKEPVLTLAQKILDIQANVPTVKKAGRNREHNYSFLQIEDAVKAVNKMLSSRRLIMTQNLRSWETVPHTGGKGYIAKIMLEWTLEDADTGEKREYVVPGEGYDTTDKGTPKAITASRKQAIITIFNLPVGDNPEAHGYATERQDAKNAAQAVAGRKIAEAASKGSASAIDAYSQETQSNKIKIGRPESFNGHYISVSGFLAPQLQQYFNDTSAKHVPAKGPYPTFWKLAAEYEQGLIKLCEKLGIEVEG